MQIAASEGSGIGRYLAIPAVVLLIILVALGARAESREDFQDRADEQSGSNSGGSSGSQGSSGSSGGSQGSSGESSQGGETRYRYDESASGDGENLEPPRRISIETDNGRIAFEPQGSDGEGITWDIDQPLTGRLIGFRLQGDEFSVVTSGAEQPGDILISWSDEQVVLSEVGGGVTQVERNGETISGTHTEPDQTVTTFEQSDDNPVRINDQLQAEPEDVGPIFGTDPSQPFDPPFGDSWPWGWIGLAVALTMFFSGMWLTFKDGLGLAVVEFSIPQHTKPARRNSPADELGLFERLRQNPDADAVVRELYERASSGEWGLPARHLEETPLEFHQRIREGLPTEATLPLSQLTDLYSAVRFAPHTATLEDRDRAIDMAQRLLHHMQTTARQPEGIGV